MVILWWFLGIFVVGVVTNPLGSQGIPWDYGNAWGFQSFQEGRSSQGLKWCWLHQNLNRHFEHICMYIYIYWHICIYNYTVVIYYIYIYSYIHIYIYTHYIYIYTYIYIHMCIYIYTYHYISVCQSLHCTMDSLRHPPPLICCRIPPEDYGSETTTVRWGKATYIHSSYGAVRLIFKVFGEMIYNLIWLVVYLPLWKIWKSVGIIIIPNNYIEK